MIEFFDYEISADAYKVRLLMTLLGLTWRTTPVEYYPRAEHRADWFLAISPHGKVPVIIDDGTIVDDVPAMLVHLARRHDPTGTWYPQGDPPLTGQVTTWLTFADALAQTAAAARLHDGLLQHDIDITSARSGAHDLLRVLDEHLWFGEQTGTPWLCPGVAPTVADIACFPDVMLAEEGGIALRPYPAVRRWTTRVKHLPGFVVMPGIFPA